MTVESLITQHIDTWTSAVKTKSTSGRGSSKKLELYGVKKLRELILELAVRGKLVPQDPSDEPASVLLERIAAEKAQLVKEKKIKKPKNLPEISDEEKLFELPLGWEWAKLGNVATLKGGFAYKSKEFVDSGIHQVIRMGNVRPDEFLLDQKTAFIEQNYADMTSEYQLSEDDVLLTMTGTKGKRDYLYSLVVSETHLNGRKLYLNQRLCSLSSVFCFSKFINVAVKSNTLLDTIFCKSTGTANQANIGMDAISNWIVPIAPIEEQHRIVAKVDELMALCDQLEQQTEASIESHQLLVSTLLNTLTHSADANELMENWARISDHFDTLFTTEESIDQLKQTILQLAVMGKLVPQDPNDEPASVLLERLNIERNSWLLELSGIDNECKTMLRKLKKLGQPKSPFPLPKTWACTHLIELSRLLVDCHNKTAPYVDSGIPIIRTTNIRERKFVNKDLKYVNQETYEYWSRRCPPQHGDIMFTREAPMGEALIIPEGSKWCLGQRTMLIRPMHDYVSNEFLLLALTEPHLLERASEHAVGLTVKHLRVGDVENLNVPIPPLREQYEIVAKVNELMAICEQFKQRLKESQATQLHLTDAIVEQAV
ncbi:restriction endonuclease subunit S [Photobacterium damselae]|uniref:restriction endonuclease subunit S n=1 Tax=Photobacterium damselae TaxID=38293 RepID=UPI002090CEEB|nr:restriction endonuclease subunit S [Photobacterium damselae]USR76081.1 restriction endonuclease subunit S [Photobacterium damselae]